VVFLTHKIFAHNTCEVNFVVSFIIMYNICNVFLGKISNITCEVNFVVSSTIMYNMCKFFWGKFSHLYGDQKNPLQIEQMVIIGKYTKFITFCKKKLEIIIFRWWHNKKILSFSTFTHCDYSPIWPHFNYIWSFKVCKRLIALINGQYCS
jgi:hypothetical protein